MLMWMLGVVTAWAVSVGEVPNPRPQGGWVTDMADVLEDAAEQRLNVRISQLQHDLGVEIAVVTLTDVDAATPKQFATSLFNHWKIGDAEANNGLLVLLVMGDRRLEMETGVGLEGVLSDGWLGSMQAKQMVPLFKDGRFGAGLEEGVAAVEARLRWKADEAMEGTRGKVVAQIARDAEAEGQTPWWLGGAMGLGLGGLGAAGVAGGLAYRRRHRCPTCDVDMVEVSEEEDDAFLSSHQQVEERIGSVNYVVHQCDICGFHKIKRKATWWSGFGNCPRCKHVTLREDATTVQYATRKHGGRVQHHDHCAACGYDRTYVRRTPKLPPPSSSGGGYGGGGFSGGGGGFGGGSFGGGSSGGGGAGSSF